MSATKRSTASPNGGDTTALPYDAGYCEPIHETPSALERLPAGYRQLFHRAVKVLGSDDRVRGVWLSGSLARGTADEASDLDLLVAVADHSYEEFASSWREWLADITPTVLAEEQWFSKGSFWSVTPGFERFDVVLEPVSKLSATPFPVRALVFERDDLTASLAPRRPPSGPSPSAVAKLIEEWFHFSAMPETILVRQDWLLAAEHLHFLRGLIYKLYVESNQPMPAMGLKQWSAKLTTEQRAVLRQLPTSVDDVTSLVRAHLACARAFLGAARPMAADLGVEWPRALEQAAADHLRAVLAVEEPYPG